MHETPINIQTVEPHELTGTSRHTQPYPKKPSKRFRITDLNRVHARKTKVGQLINLAGSRPGETREYEVQGDGSLRRTSPKPRR